MHVCPVNVGDESLVQLPGTAATSSRPSTATSITVLVPHALALGCKVECLVHLQRAVARHILHASTSGARSAACSRHQTCVCCARMNQCTQAPPSAQRCAGRFAPRTRLSAAGRTRPACDHCKSPRQSPAPQRSPCPSPLPQSAMCLAAASEGTLGLPQALLMERWLTFRLECDSLPARAFSKVVLPAPGGPSSSVMRPCVGVT